MKKVKLFNSIQLFEEFVNSGVEIISTDIKVVEQSFFFQENFAAVVYYEEKSTNKEELISYIYEFAQLYGQYYHNKDFDAIMEKVSEKIEIPEEFLKSIDIN